MERSIIFRTVRRIAGASMLTGALFACHSSTQTRELRDARQAYHDAAADPATKRVPQEMANARLALDEAERAHNEAPGSDREARFAEIAEHRAELAQARGKIAEAESDAAAAKQKAREEAAEADEKAAKDKAEARNEAAEAERDAQKDKVEARRDAADAQRELAKERADVHADARKDKDKVEVTAEHERSARRSTNERDHVAHASAPARVKLSPNQEADAALQNLAGIASVKQESRGTVITMSGSLLFPTGKEELSPIGRTNMDQVAGAVAKQPDDRKIAVEGYTDNTGSAAANERLSKKRAQAVADQLVDRGIDKQRIEVVGYGEKRPIASNDTEEGRALNRRVEIVIAPAGQSPVAMNEQR